MEVLTVACIVHDGHFDGCALLFSVKIDNIVEKVCTAAVNVAYKILESALAVELLCASVAFCIGAKVCKCYCDARVQICEFAHTVGQDVIFVDGGGENVSIGPKLLSGTAAFCLAYDFYASDGLSASVFLSVDFTIAEDLGNHFMAERVYAGYTHTMETAAHLVATLVEFSAGMQYGHYDFQGALVLLFVHVYRNASTVVLYGDAVVLVDCDFYFCAISSQRFINGVVYGFIHKMVQTLFADVANIHGGTLAHGFKTFQYLDIGCAILRIVLLKIFHFKWCLVFGYKFTKKN